MIEYQVWKSLTRIATNEQTMEELVNGEHKWFGAEDETLQYMLEKAKPGVRLEVFYYPVPPSEKTIGVGNTFIMWCDEFLTSDGKVDLEKFEAVARENLAKEFKSRPLIYP